MGGQFGELDIADTGNRVLLDHELVTVGCSEPAVAGILRPVPGGGRDSIPINPVQQVFALVFNGVLHRV